MRLTLPGLLRASCPLAAAFLLVLSTDGAAQRRVRGGSFFHGPVQVGLRGGRDFENHAWSLGGQIQVPMGRNLELRPSGDVFFPREGSDGWQLNGDGAIRLGQGGGLYAGGGIALVHLDDSDTETGYNLFFGLSTAPPLSRWKPFLEFRWTFVNDTSPFRLALGFGYGL
ncbi:MAG: hypothetical protein ACREMX_01405 [Gemmatimonadales bacterium]